ncbi:hypothetical protein K2173_016812 [Erythroxylum novogranatense]|uniref:Protein GRIM REAPER-like n=1 Tax=Erythroxylum novogranatense TaxID=1862640 RepID=A0AAV8SSX5_9ROSI|nr:hypothetical protein K2173_016812 [Erythroxylum novogranatense]
MALSLLQRTTIRSLLIPLLLLLHAQMALSTDIEDYEEYFLDTQNLPHFRSRSRFLAGLNRIKKGAYCNARGYNICNGVPANNGTSLLYCCKKHCRNVIRDENNCGKCGKKCKFSEHCCNGRCINAMKDQNNCSKCNHKCGRGLKCEYGSCGYA